MKKIITALLALAIGFAIIAPTQNAEAQVVVSNRCCDLSGTVRCLMPVMVPIGSGCVCFGQGGGLVC
jgi:hypothetical protein